MSIRKKGTFANQPVEVRRAHVRIAGRGNGVEALLIRQQDEKIGLLGRHSGKFNHRPGTQKTPRSFNMLNHSRLFTSSL